MTLMMNGRPHCQHDCVGWPYPPLNQMAWTDVTSVQAPDTTSTRDNVALTVPHVKWDMVDVASPRVSPTQPCVDLMSTQFAAALMGHRCIIAPSRCCVAPGRRNGRLNSAPGAVASASASLHQGCLMQPWTRPTQCRPGSTQGWPASMQHRLWST